MFGNDIAVSTLFGWVKELSRGKMKAEPKVDGRRLKAEGKVKA